MAQPTPLTIRGAGTSWAVLQGARVLRHYTSHGNATAALRGLEARQQPRQSRPCLNCGGPFLSTGPGNRLCDDCGVL